MTHPTEPFILIVDDNPTNLSVLSKTLKEAGHKVRMAVNGEDALAKIDRARPELILLDVMMPGIDGFETCQRLKAQPNTKEIPIIFMTALSDAVNKVAGLKMGAVDYITKPIEIDEVLARINIHLTLKKTQSALTHEVIERRQTEAQLRSALVELKQTQTKLIQTERMSSLGQLVAGIAHEINNPVNFILGNLQPAHYYTQDLLELLDLYQQKFPTTDPEIQQKAEAVDLSFVINDLPKILGSMKVGAERIREIVLSLRIFSRLHEVGLKKVDLHQGIDSTLTLLSHRLIARSDRAAIQVIRNYGEIPLVECDAGQINQVLMNLLNNAIEAIEATQQANPVIQISTSMTENAQVLIQIADNGIGMTEETQQQIFDPFFTTKEVGTGTGMGLAISYQIVQDQHQGKLECRSQFGAGTEFQMLLPLYQPS